MSPIVREHKDLPLGPFKGLWDRGDAINTPLDHFQDCNNLISIGNNWETRPGIAVSQTVSAPIGDIKRAYDYQTLTANTQLILIDDSGTGKIYHLVNASTIYGPILSISGMTDFAFVGYAGRAYISPFGTFTTGDINIQKGLQNEFLYVYKGDGTNARKAAGIGPTDTALTITNGAAGHTDAGFHLFGTVFEYDTGYLSPIKQITGFNTSPANSVSFAGIQTTGDTTVVRVHIVVTKVIASYNGDTTGYQFYFLPNGTVNNGVTVLNNTSFFDQDLVDDASHLLDNYTSIPAGANLSIYNDRLILGATYTDISICLVSTEGEPEAIDQVNGIIIVPPNGDPITNHRSLRGVMYVFKRSQTIGYTDNGGDPSSWPPVTVDAGLGTSVHGIAEVLASGSASVDFLIIATYAGIMVFNGKYIQPELTYKVSNLWKSQTRNLYRKIQISLEPTRKWILIVLPDGRLLCGDYSQGLDYKNIRWTPLSFYVVVNCILVVNIDNIIVGMDNPNINMP